MNDVIHVQYYQVSKNIMFSSTQSNQNVTYLTEVTKYHGKNNA